MITTRLRLAFATLFVLILTVPGTGMAQTGPDIRNIRPHVMLLLETAGSMSRTPSCVCTTPACNECEPDCAANQETRWALVTQALTGQWSPFECDAKDPRTTDALNTYTYDDGYFIPDFKFPNRITGYTGTQGPGLLDDYRERVKVGLMTTDGVGTIVNTSPAVLQSNFEVAAYLADSAGSQGLFSYGDNKPFTFSTSFPGPYMINSGARSETATEGALVSVGTDSDDPVTHATALKDQILNVRPYGASPTSALLDDFRYYIQNHPDMVEKVADPGPGDSFFNCRNRTAVFIVDGFPNGEMRGPPYYCELSGNPPGPTGCPYDEAANIITAMISSGELDAVYVIGFSLSDATEEATLRAYLDDLALVGMTDQATLVGNTTEMIDALAVIFNAINPGSTTRTAPAFTGVQAGVDPATNLAGALPVFEFFSGFNPSFSATNPWDGFLERRRFSCDTGVPVAQPITAEDKFQDVLDAQATAPSNVSVWSDEASPGFGSGFSRNLWTVLPSNTSAGAAEVNDHLIGHGRDKLTDLGDPRFRPFSSLADGITRNVDAFEFNKNLEPEVFGLPAGDTAARDSLVDWIHGVPGSAREDERLGDIYHSTPAVVGPITLDTEDGSFNEWRIGTGGLQQSPDPSEDLSTTGWHLNFRPRVVYAASNDGVIHAFLADETQNNHYNSRGASEFQCADGLAAGTELWGFIPPMVLDDLQNLPNSASKRWLADGNIYVRDMFDVRPLDEFTSVSGGTPAGGFTVSATNVWRTVLFMTFRNGGAGMIALDVTNPCKPEFLWQFTEEDLGATYGQPTSGTVILETTDRDDFRPRQARGVIVLPGGEGNRDTASEPCAPPAGPARPGPVYNDATGSNVGVRTNRRCWHTTTDAQTAGLSNPASGRALYFIDLLEGTVIRKLDDTIFPSPVTGSVSVFRGDVATTANSAYVQDEDGILWRVNMTKADPQDWDAQALHDLYYDSAALPLDTPQPGFTPPTLSIDPAGNVVVLHATGNIDILDDPTARNRVISLTEDLTFDSDGSISLPIRATLNWDLNAGDELALGEQVTGPLDLFSGNVFFGTFNAASTNPINSCPFEGSRIWGVSYLDNPLSVGNPEPKLTNSLGTMVTNLGPTDLPELGSSLVMGLRLAQSATCVNTSEISVTDPFTGVTRNVKAPTSTSGGGLKLVAHLSGAQSGTDGGSVSVFEREMPSLSDSMTETSVDAIADVIE